MVSSRKDDPVLVHADEQMRPHISIESLAKLRSAFKKEGAVTTSNASTLNDAAAMVVMSDAEVAHLELPILAVIAAVSGAGLDPDIMDAGPIVAPQKVLKKQIG